jgi:hypothetical protein
MHGTRADTAPLAGIRCAIEAAENPGDADAIAMLLAEDVVAMVSDVCLHRASAGR